ncbi:Herc2 [Symbiodinium microadriaticum]|nr:Herc2 [Symbiodinium microadriaticum]
MATVGVLGVVLAAVLLCFSCPPAAFSPVPRGAFRSSGGQLHTKASRVMGRSQAEGAPQPDPFGGFGGHHREGLFTALVAAASTLVVSAIQAVTQIQLWVPPFGAIVLIFAAEAVAAAKAGKILCRRTMWSRGLRACSGVAGACLFTVGISDLLGHTPVMLRVVAMFAAAFSMTVNPSAGYFPPAGAFCAIYVEKVVTHGLRPGLGYAFFPCGVGVALLLITTRLVTFLMAHPLWKMKKVAKSYRAARMRLLRHGN